MHLQWRCVISAPTKRECELFTSDLVDYIVDIPAEAKMLTLLNNFVISFVFCGKK